MNGMRRCSDELFVLLEMQKVVLKNIQRVVTSYEEVVER